MLYKSNNKYLHNLKKQISFLKYHYTKQEENKQVERKPGGFETAWTQRKKKSMADPNSET